MAGGAKARVAKEDEEPSLNLMLHFVRAVGVSTQCLAAF